MFGNFDKDSTNDYVLRNEVEALPSNSSSRSLFAFASSWRVLQNETIFRYNESNAQTWAFYYNESFNFVPIFIDEIKLNTTAILLVLFKNDTTFYQDANNTCFTKQYDDIYYQCLVDIAYSGSLAAGDDSKSQNGNISKSQQQIGNAGPSISGAPDSVNIRWNQSELISFQVTSGYTFNITILGAAIIIQNSSLSNSTNNSSTNSSVTISNDIPNVLSMNSAGNITTVTLKWTPSSLSITGFTVSVTDSLGATASWAPVTYYCTCINAASVCLYPNVSTNLISTSNSTLNTSPLVVVNCTCPGARSGPRCKISPCASSPCFMQVDCTETSDGLNYTCGQCPTINNTKYVGDGINCTGIACYLPVCLFFYIKN